MVSSSLHDWGKIYQGSSEYCTFAPATDAEVSNLLRMAYDRGMKIRIRGRGHSMNGTSLPRTGEVLLSTENIRHYSWKSPREISVGGGVTVYALHEWLKKRNASLPIFNDGVLGPSVGGYISASGIGTRSAVYGGFWENVTYIALIDATGKMHRIERKNPLFRWIFGSMGQFGVIYEAGLRVIPQADMKFTPSNGTIEEAWEREPEAAGRTADYQTSRLTWFTIISPSERKKELAEDLEKLKVEHAGSLSFIPNYSWLIRKHSFTPPLFYPEHRELICIGIWGHGDAGDSALNAKILKLSDAVMDLLQQKHYYRRYIQSEPLRITTNWEQYWGPKIFKEFRTYHTRLNPIGNLNDNCFFGCDGDKTIPAITP